MNSLGKLLQIAEFASWWQVISCYALYLLPASLLRLRAFHDEVAGTEVVRP